MISTQNLSIFGLVKNPSTIMSADGNFDLEFFDEMEVDQIESFTNQTECDVIFQLSVRRSFFPTNFLSNPTTI